MRGFIIISIVLAVTARVSARVPSSSFGSESDLRRSLTTSTAYDLANRRTITTQPGGAITATEVDTLGRVIASKVDTGSSPIEQRVAYDLAGNRVYSTDLVAQDSGTLSFRCPNDALITAHKPLHGGARQLSPNFTPLPCI